MNKDFSENKLLEMKLEKQFKVLYDLASFIEINKHAFDSGHFQKLSKYHRFLKDSPEDKLQKLNKEFSKVKDTGYQFQIYLMNLERLLGQSKKDYDFLVNTGDQSNQSIKAFPITCLLDSVRSAHNIGSIFRNAECFGVEQLILCGLSPTPDSIQVQKTAMGCDEVLKWKYEKSAVLAIKNLKDLGHKVYAVETSKRSINLNKLEKISGSITLIFGHEQFGISLEVLELCDEIIAIELYGQKNSLNVSISNAIVLNKVSDLLNKTTSS
jgi:tRNA G18 (ribose-2'-O)-methylase SpoU